MLSKIIGHFVLTTDSIPQSQGPFKNAYGRREKGRQGIAEDRGGVVRGR